MFKTNQPAKVIHLHQLANQSSLNGALVKEIVSNSFSESKKNKARKVKKKIRYGLKNIFPPDFINYLSYSEVQKYSKVVNV